MKKNKQDMVFGADPFFWEWVVSVLIMATGQQEDTKYYTVSVVVNNSGSSRWTSLKEGAEAGGKGLQYKG